MKKQFLFIIAVLFMSANAIAMTANLSTHSVTPSNSFAGYDVQLLVTSNGSSSFCYGTFTVSFQRQQTYPTLGAWQLCTATPVTGTSTSNIQTLNKLYQIGQLNGTKYNYKVTVTFNPSAGGGTCATAPNTSQLSNTVLVDVSMTACFELLYKISTEDEPSYYGPQPVATICSPTATIDGSCSQNEQGYYVGINEFNLDTWTNGTTYYSGWVSGTGQAPSLISLISLISQNNANTNYTPHTSFDPTKIYSVGLAVGPIWNSAPQRFFRVLTCKMGDEVSENPTAPISAPDDVNKHSKKSKFTTYPNPSNGVVIIEKTEANTVLKSVTIYDANNVAIKTSSLENANSQEIDITSLRAGIYVMKVETNEGVFVEKIVKN